jgi:hypothetical protein
VYIGVIRARSLFMAGDGTEEKRVKGWVNEKENNSRVG